MAWHSRTVLVVEDDLLIRMILAEALHEEGYLVFEAGTALEAVAVIGGHRVDALITDIDMPGGLSGLDLATMVAGGCRNVATIIVSGGHVLGKAQLPRDAQFLSKPYRLEDITSALTEMMSLTAEADFRVAL